MMFAFSRFWLLKFLSFGIHRHLFVSLLSISFTRWPTGDIALIRFNKALVVKIGTWATAPSSASHPM